MSLLLPLEEPNSQVMEIETISETQIDHGKKPLLRMPDYQENMNMIKLLKKLIFTLLVSALCVCSYTVSEARIFVHHEIGGTLVKGVKVNAGKLHVASESGYTCSTENGKCVCLGDADSEDCQAMAENICKTDEHGDVDLSCNGIICSCDWGSALGVDGVDGNIPQTQGAN
jgi:hypothetical protein